MSECVFVKGKRIYYEESEWNENLDLCLKVSDLKPGPLSQGI